MNNILLLYTIIILLSILCLSLIFIVISYRNKIKESALLIKKYKESLNRDYNKDIEFLEKVITTKIEYLEHSVIPFIDKDNKVITDEDLNRLIASTVVDIRNTISEPYKELLNFYITDLDSFIAFEIKNILQPTFVKKNIKTLKGDNYVETIFPKSNKN